ncbi:MAG: peptidoglycan/xylan/chitin deacetylase (PgdA/CDA1 family) [Bacteroidia bacterium]|jgi:peptidoglycan/xylan/chitin deacetylase (PgdA/CDA1 family)
MPLSKLLRALLVLALLILVVAACAPSPQRELSMAGMDIVAKDDRYALVRLGRQQTFEDLATVFLGHRAESWQIREVNADQGVRSGQIVAVPLQPVNPSSVYTDGYRTLPILCYHQFSVGKASHQLELSAQEFEQQIKYLLDNEYYILSFAQVREIMLQGRPIPERAVVLTIDDGYRSVYDVAWPILKKHNVKATLFNYTDFIGAPAALTWAQIKEMSASGLIEIESHAKSHSSLSQQPSDISEAAYLARLREEIAGSNKAFRRHLGKAPSFLSYPYGNSSKQASDVARQEGMFLAATVTRGRNAVFADPYLLHRSMVYDRHDMADFEGMLQTFTAKQLK